MSRERVKKSLKLLLSNKVDKERLIPATLGAKIKGSKKVKVPDRDQYVYVRIHGRESEIAQAFNDKTNYIYDLPVLLKKEGNRYVVVGRDTMRYPEWIENQTNVPPHGMQHSFYGGTDITWIHKKQFTPFSVSPLSGTVVYVNEDWFLLDENYFHFTGTPVNLAGAYPLGVNQARFVTLYFDTNSLLIKGITGTLFDINPLPDNLDPYIPSIHVSAGIPLASIFVNSVNKTVNWNSIYDLRPFFTGKSLAYSTMGKLAIYDNGIIKVTGSAIDFGNNLFVSTTGSIAFVDATSSIAKNSSLVGQREKLNFIEGGGIGIGVTDEPANNQVNVTLTITGSGVPHYIADIQGTLATGSSVATFIVTDKHDIEYVYARCGTLGVTGTTIIDVNKNGSTIFTTQPNRPSIAYNDSDGIDKKAPDITSVDELDVISIDIDSVAQGAKDLQVVIKGFGLTTSPSGNRFGLVTPQPPNLDDFTWINQGTATVTQFTGGLFIYDQPGSGVRWRILAKTLNNSSNYRVTLGFYAFLPFYDYYNAGILLLDDNDKIFSTRVYRTRSVFTSKWDSPTSFNSSYIELQLYYPQPIWLRVEDNGTNRISYYSFDGINFIQYHSVSRTDFLTPTKVGFGLDVENTSYPGAITVIHWKEEPL